MKLKRIMAILLSLCMTLCVAQLPAMAQTTQDGFEYLIEGELVTVTGYTGSATELEIPAEIEGLPVTKIGDYAFLGKTAITSIKIPDSVSEIGVGAFYMCTKLAEIDLGQGVETIGDDAFNSCKSLLSLTLPDSARSIGNWAFKYCEGLKTVDLGNGLETIGNEAFYDCMALTEITVPDSVTSIGNWAFDFCETLKTVNLGAGITI